MQKQEVLKACTVNGLVVKLPDTQLDRKLYQEVAAALTLIGGKWKGGKVQGFEFQEDPTDLLEEIQSGEKRNLKKEFQFFETPADLADRLVEYAKIEKGHKILEPSAGQGAIVKAICRKLPTQSVYCYELMPLNQTILRKIPAVKFLAADFMESDLEMKFDRIIGNPPFNKNQDIDHLQRMYDRLEKGGKLVCITSAHWVLSENKKEKQFKAWLSVVQAKIFEIRAGEFKTSGTMVGGRIIVIDKSF